MAHKPLNNKQLKCIELLVQGEKLKGEIAEELNIRRETISAWVKREDFQAAMREEMYRQFGAMALKARRKLDALVDDPNPQVALAAAKEVLNKAGYKEKEIIEQEIKTPIEITIVD